MRLPGGAPGQWTPADVVEVLFSTFPAKIMWEPDELAELPDAAAEFLRFLADRFPLMADEYEALAEGVACSAAQFVSVMSDENNWGLGKRMWSTAEAEGVALGDQASMDAWMEEFNQRPRFERDQVLGPSALPTRGDQQSTPVPAGGVARRRRD